MRPLELALEGFRSYGERTVFDWRSRRLVGIVGPIGSGKSSLLDAVAFALYGQTPALGRSTRALVKHGAASARVELLFEVDGQVWRAVRLLRAKGAGRHALYRYSAGDPGQGEPGPGEAGPGEDGEPDLCLDREAEVNRRIEQLVGLDFAAFCRSVLLAQNRFSEFLTATGTERDKVLKGVFGFDRLDAMQEVARQRRAAAELEVREKEGRLATVEDDRRRLAEAKEALETSSAAASNLETAEPKAREIERRAEEAGRRRRQAEASGEHLERLAAELPPEAEVERLEGAFEEADGKLSRAEEGLRQATEACAAAEEAHRETVEVVGGGEDLGRAETALTALDRERRRGERAAQRVEEARRQAEKAAAAATEAAAALEDARRQAALKAEELERAEEAFHRAQHRDMAAALRAGLQPGETCPVCEQPVTALPEEEAEPAELDAAAEIQRQARQAREAAEREVSKRVSREAAALQEAKARERSAAEAAEARREAEEAVAEGEAALARLLGEGEPAELLARARERLAAAEERLRETQQAERGASEAVEAARAAREEARRARERLAGRLAVLAGKVGLEADEEGAPPRQRREALAAHLAAGHSAAAEERTAARGEEEAAVRERRELLATLELAGDIDFDTGLARARAARERDAATVETLSRRLDAAGELEAALAAARETQQRYERLAADLAPSKFLAYLLEEERAALAELGSERFEMLTAGRYRFTADGGFDVVDLINAEETRKSDTLSGGETFLASLALALALAEKVTGGGGRLDAFFLDEGFGSLDAEHLDLALEGIERLVTDSPQRLVTVVSHVSALRDRVEDLVVLDKDPLTGDTVVVRGAAGGE